MTLLSKNISFLTSFFFICTVLALPQNSYALNKTIDKWQTRLPDKNGFTQTSLQTAIEKIGAMNGVYGVIVIRNGYLTVEKYFREGSAETPHNLKSASKSILSALIGIAIDKGYLQLDQPISDFLPFIKEMQDQRKDKITVQHLLSMKSGLQSTSYQAYNSWIINDDWLSKLLQLPIVAEPGTKHQYSTGDSHILSAVLTAATGMSAKEFAEKYLFGPLNVEIKGWEIDPQGIYQGGNNFSLYPQDIAKFGQLYLDGGTSNGKQIVPLWWVNESTKALQPNLHNIYGGYGYLWYTHPGGEDAFVAVGYGGQYIYVSPKNKTVIVIISTLQSKGKKWETTLFKTIQHGILASIEETQPSLSPMTGAAAKFSNGITTDTVNLRKNPSTKSSIIGIIEPGTILAIVAKKNSWLQIQHQQQEGWLASGFVHIIEPKKMALATESPFSKQKNPLAQRLSPLEKSLQTRVDKLNIALKKLKVSQQEVFTLLKEYAEKQATFQNYSASQKKEQAAIQQQISQLQESALKIITRNNQTDKSLDSLLLANDQIISHQQGISLGLATLQKSDQHFAHEQKVRQASDTAIKQSIENLQEKLASDIASVTASRNKTMTEVTVTTKNLHDGQNLLKKEVQEAALRSQSNTNKIVQLQLADKQYRMQQGEMHNELYAIKDDVIANKLLSKSNIGDQQKKLDQITSELVTFIKEIAEIKTNLNLLQKSSVAADDSHFDLLSITKAVTTTLRDDVEKEKIGQNQLAALIDALKISLTSVISKNRQLEENFLSYKNKEEIIAAKVLYLENELREQQQFPKKFHKATSAFESKLDQVQKELRALQRTPRETIVSQVEDREKKKILEKKIKTVAKIPPKIVKVESVQLFISSWSDAWSQQDVPKYLHHYSSNFRPSKNLSLKQWKANRQQSLTKPKYIKITISDLQTEPIDQDNVRAVFRQSYKSDNYSDSVIKTLYLNWQGFDLKIIQEKSN